MNELTEWRTVEQVWPIKASQKGNPQCGIRTDRGMVTVRGAVGLLQQVQVGRVVEIGKPSEFTNPSTGKTAYYAELKKVEERMPAPPAYGNGWPAPEQTRAPAASPEYGLPVGVRDRIPINSETVKALPEPQKIPTGFTKIPWAEFEAVFRAAHRLAMEVEPDELADEDDGRIRIDRSRARAAMVNTAMIAFKDGRIDAPIFGEDSPEGAPPF